MKPISPFPPLGEAQEPTDAPSKKYGAVSLVIACSFVGLRIFISTIRLPGGVAAGRDFPMQVFRMLYPALLLVAAVGVFFGIKALLQRESSPADKICGGIGLLVCGCILCVGAIWLAGVAQFM